MSEKDLFSILADYVNFAIDFIKFRGMNRYILIGSVSSELVAFFVAGVFIAYLIAIAKTYPGYRKHIDGEVLHKEDKEKNKDEEKVASADMALFVLRSILLSLIAHIILVVFAVFFRQFRIGSANDTVNAFLGFNAVFHPLNSLVLKLSIGAKGYLIIRNKRIKIIDLMVCFRQIFIIISYLYLFHSIATIHAISYIQLFQSFVFIITILIIILLGLLMGTRLFSLRKFE